MKSNYPLGTIELKGSRLFLSHCTKGFWQEIDITSVWHFFLEVKEYELNPIPPSDKPKN